MEFTCTSMLLRVNIEVHVFKQALGWFLPSLFSLALTELHVAIEPFLEWVFIVHAPGRV